jgi:hypothetical protein
MTWHLTTFMISCFVPLVCLSFAEWSVSVVLVIAWMCA